jgi:hydrogenase-4 component B
MLKVAIYGFIRFVFDLTGEFQLAWGVVVLTVGSVSALLGVLLALMQHDLKRLLAYHSVENIGIIFIGLGLALIFLGTGQPALSALPLVAALYHTLNHAVFKSLLFFGAGAIQHSAHEQDLEHMGGLLRRMPWTGGFFLVGCISISALPPFNGFVSEWLTYQAALQAWQLESGVLRSLIPIVTATLALTGARAAACFVKVYGVAFLGRARSRHVRRARPVPKGMRTGQGLLAACCALLGVLPIFVVDLITRIPEAILSVSLPQATSHGWLWLTPISPDTASYSAPWLVLILVLVAGATALMLRRGTVRRVRRSDPWDCGFAPPTPRMQYSASAFSQPIRRVFGLAFHIDERLERDDGNNLRHHIHVDDRSWSLFYEPVANAINAASRRVLRLQSGNVRVYLGWTLSTLLVLLWIIS